MKLNFYVLSIISTIITVVIIPMSFAYAQSLEKNEDALLGFKLQYPKEWKGLLEYNHEKTGVVFNLSPLIGKHELLNNNLYVYKDYPISNKTQKQYIREFILDGIPYYIREV